MFYATLIATNAFVTEDFVTLYFVTPSKFPLYGRNL